MYLLIDLSEKDIIRLSAFDEDQKRDVRVSGRNRDLLAAIDDFFRDEGVDKNDIQGIATVVGAGGFTSTRIAAVVANAFAYIRKIPVVAIKKEDADNISFIIYHLSSRHAGEYISSTYSGEPNIGRKS